MQPGAKEWLVRTRMGEILGPFTQRELIEELARHTFSVEDEIAPSFGHWVSAQALSNREAEEFTRTATKSHAFTRSIHTKPSAAAEASITASVDELTPTPSEEEIPPLRPETVFRQPPEGHGGTPWRSPLPRKRPLTSRAAPVVTFLFVLAAVLALLSQVKRKKEAPPIATSSPSVPASSPGESVFVRGIYEMIHRGEYKAALQQLTQYHERNAGRGEVDYLIPYAALLIMEGEAPGRARRFLEQVLASSTTAQLKAQAHHWLGYLMLSLDTDDAGESHFLDSLQLNTKDAASRFNLGRAYLKQGKLSPALDYFQLAELERPDLWLIHIYKGRARAELNQNEEARACFLKAIAVSPDRWISYMYYAVFQLKIGEIEGAQATIKKMLTRDPKFEINSPQPWGFFQERINYVEYLSAFTQIMARAAGEEKEMGKLYISYLNNGGQGNEGAKIEAVAEKGGLMSKVLALKVVLDREAPADEIRVAANRLPPVLSDFGYYAYVLRGEARLRLGNLPEAQADFKRAVDLEPKSALARFSQAVILKRLQRTEEAQSEMRELLARHPSYIPAIVLSKNF